MKPTLASPPVSQSSGHTTRIIGLDALRAIAMMLGIVHHACLAYVAHTQPGLLWPVRDPERSLTCDVIFIWTHGFRLPIFFVLSGYFAELLTTMRGPGPFFKHRLDRLVVPYAVALVTIGNLMLAVSVWGWLISGICTWEQLVDPAIPLPPEMVAAGFGPGHLWFLQDLILISCLYWLLRRDYIPASTPFPSQAVASHAPLMFPRRWWHPLACALPTALLLWGDLSPAIAFHNSFVPDPARLLYYGLYFGWGVLFYRHRREFQEAARSPWLRLLGGLAISVVMVYFTLRQETQPTLFGGFMIAVTTALFAWLFIFGWFGVFLHHWTLTMPAVRYLSDSAYWIYLFHLPLVVVLQILLHGVALAPVLKMLLITVVTFGITLVTYQLFVRHTWIGRMLHGPR